MKAKILTLIILIGNISITDSTDSIDTAIERADLNSYKIYVDAIGKAESSCRYNIVNKYGYMGKYQFGNAALKYIGFNVSRKKFLNSVILQEIAMLKLLKSNKKRLKKWINKYSGKKINGVVITESGILAGAHLGGVGGVRKFLDHGYDRKDAFGTPVSKYITKFSGYHLVLDNVKFYDAEYGESIDFPITETYFGVQTSGTSKIAKL